MSKLFKLKPVLSVLLVALMLVTSNSCKKDDKDKIPELPPVAALLMDFSDFEDVPGVIKAVSSYDNFGYAVSNVVVWNLIATVLVAVPCVAYAEAFNHEAVYLGENSWQWLYSVTADQSTFTAKLISKRISNEEFTLEMLVSKSGTGGFEDFKWFEGTVRYDHTAANWTLYSNPEVTSPVMTIDWTMDWEEELYSIRYTNVQAGNDYGSYIEHGVTGNSPFNAYYNISTTEGTVQIEWNKTTKAGHVKSPEHFGDSDWHCWNENLLDTVCE
jgi:hypothetical protein